MNAVAAFLDRSHEELAERVSDWAGRELRTRPEPAGDDAARREAKYLLPLLADAGLLSPIASQDLRGICIVREAVAAANPLADEVVAIQGLGIAPLLLAGSEAQRRRWVPELASGRAMAAFAMTEPEAGSDVASMRTVARPEGSGWIITGEKHLISNAGIADLHLVFAKTSPEAGSRGISLFIVERDRPGLEFSGAQMMAAAHPLGRLRFNECYVAADALVGGRDHGFKIGMMTLDRLRPTVGAAACGMASRALAEAIAHARDRQQFGAPLAAMPLVREKIGRMATELDASRLLVYRAAWEQSRGAARITTPAAMAKGFATEAAQRIIDDAVQIVGGRGVLVGHPVERLYRAVRALRIYEGATDVQRLIVAAGVLDGAGSA